MKLVWSNSSKGEKIRDSILLSIVLIVFGYYLYLDYPDFSSSKLIWISIKDTFTWISTLIILGFSTLIGLVAFLLGRSVEKEVNSLNIGDKISYNGCKGILKSVDKNRSVIEIDVPLMSLSKDKSE